MNSYLYSVDIEKLLKKGESETLEFKENFSEETIIAIAAMANCKGGTVLIGVSDKGYVKGTNVGKESFQKWLNEISLATNHNIIPDIHTHKIDDKAIRPLA